MIIPIASEHAEPANKTPPIIAFSELLLPPSISQSESVTIERALNR